MEARCAYTTRAAVALATIYDRRRENFHLHAAYFVAGG
jgi:hypothetical protein